MQTSGTPIVEIRNCFIQPKPGDTWNDLFGAGVCLDGYAIIPREEYTRLKARADGSQQ